MRARTEREAWVREGLAVLAEGAPEAVRVEAIARRLGVTKGGFYGFFAGRDQLLDEMLDLWERSATQDVAARLAAEELAPAVRAHRAAQLTWEAGWLLGVDLAVRDWARRDAAVARRLERVDRYRYDYLAEQLRAAGVPAPDVETVAMLAYTSAIGRHYAGLPLRELGDGVGERAVALLLRR